MNLKHRLPLVTFTSVLCIAISIFSLKSGIFIVFQNLFYIPIIISCFYYKKQGFAISVALSCIYFFLIIAFTSDLIIIRDAVIRVIIFIIIAAVVTALSIGRARAEEERERLIAELEATLSQVRQLEGIIPICAYCKKIRDDQDIWHRVEQYITVHPGAQFSHSICPTCFAEEMK